MLGSLHNPPAAHKAHEPPPLPFGLAPWTQTAGHRTWFERHDWARALAFPGATHFLAPIAGAVKCVKCDKRSQNGAPPPRAALIKAGIGSSGIGPWAAPAAAIRYG